MDNKLVEKAYDRVVDIFGETKTNKALVLSALTALITFAGYLFFGPDELPVNEIIEIINKEEN